jgi:hypothetical protein
MVSIHFIGQTKHSSISVQIMTTPGTFINVLPSKTAIKFGQSMRAVYLHQGLMNAGFVSGTGKKTGALLMHRASFETEPSYKQVFSRIKSDQFIAAF